MAALWAWLRALWAWLTGAEVVAVTELLYATSHITGTFATPDNANGNTPSTWAGVLNQNATYTSRWAIGDPVDPLTGSATQTVRVTARKGSNSGVPTLALNLYENGTLVQAILAATNVTSTTGQVLEGTFNSSAITNRADVEIEVVEVPAGGGPSIRNSAQISFIEWTADTTAAGVEGSAAGAFGFTGTASGVVGSGGGELTRTNVHSQASAEPFGTGDFTTSSFTPPDNCLLVVCVATMRVSTVTDLTSSITCAGGGWTYTPRVGRGSSTSVFSVSQRIFTAPVTTGASMTLTIGTGGINMQFYAVSVVAYTGYDTGTPTGATGSLLVEDTGSPDGAQSFTLSAAPATDSEVVAAITLDKDAAGTTPDSAWTEIHDVQAGGAGGIQSQIRTGSTSTTVAWQDTNTGGNIFKCVAAGVEIKAGAGGGTVEGTALGAFGYTGTATGVPTKLGVATGSFGFTGTAAGVPTKLGSAVGAFGYTGHANGIIPVDEITGTATGVYGYTGTAAGVPTKLGTAVGSFGYTGSAVGVPTKLGTAVGSFGFIGQALGVPTKLGVGTGSFGYTGHASGQILGAVTGTAVGAFGYTGTASGVPTKLGVAVGAFGFIGQATGTRTTFGVAVGAFGYIGNANGFVVGAIQPDPNPLRVVFAENLAPTTAESRQGVYTEGHHLIYQE